MELFEQIRRDREREGLSIRPLAERRSVHRRSVRQARRWRRRCGRRASAPSAGPAPKLGSYRQLIDLLADR